MGWRSTALSCAVRSIRLYTAYRTTARKDRQTVLDVLRLGAPRVYQLNRYAWTFLAAYGLPAAILTALGPLPQGVDLDADTLRRRPRKRRCCACWLIRRSPCITTRPALGTRQRVRKHDVSFGPRSRAGVTAWDVFGAITQTAAKLGVNVAHYLHDRLSGAYQMPSLASIITQRAAAAHAPGPLAAA